MKIRRGDVFFADLDPVTGSEQGGIRPVLIVQNDLGNQHSPTTIVACITGQLSKAKLPTHVDLPGKENGLAKHSVVLAEQLRTIDKTRLKEKICTLDKAVLDRVDYAMKISLGLAPILPREQREATEDTLSCENAEKDNVAASLEEANSSCEAGEQ